MRVKIRLHTSIHRHEGTHAHTFAALVSVVGIASWAIVTFSFSPVVGACTFFVAAAVVILARVRVIVFRARVIACARGKYISGTHFHCTNCVRATRVFIITHR